MMFRLFARIFISFVIGIILSLLVLQNTPSVHEFIKKRIVSLLEKEWNVRISLGDFKANFFSFSFFLKHGKISSANDDDYSWQFEQCKVDVPLLRLLFEKKACLNLTFNNIRCYSYCSDGKAIITDHLINIFTPRNRDIKVSPRSICLNNLDCTLLFSKKGQISSGEPKAKKVRILLSGMLQMKKNKKPNQENRKMWRGFLSLDNGAIFCNQKPVFCNLSGSTTFSKEKNTDEWCFDAMLQTKIPSFDQTDYAVHGVWSHNRKNLAVKNLLSNFDLTSSFTSGKRMDLKGTLPFSLVKNILNITRRDAAGEGTCNLNLFLTNSSKKIDVCGDIVFKKIKVGKTYLESFAVKLCNFKNELDEPTIDSEQLEKTHFLGSISWDLEKSLGHFYAKNNLTIMPFSGKTAATSLTIYPYALNFHINFDQKGLLNGAYKCETTNRAIEKKYQYKGNFVLQNNILLIKGSTLRGEYKINVATTPHPYVAKWIYQKRKLRVLDLHTKVDEPMTLRGTVHWRFIRSFLDRSIKHYVFSDKGIFNVDFDQRKLENIHGTISLKQGRFYVPDLCNIVQKIQTQISIQPFLYKLIFDNLNIELCQGNIWCPRTTLTWSQDGLINMFHFPIKIEDIFLNWKRAFYCLIDGNLLFKKIFKNTPKIVGTIILKKSLLKDIPFNKQKNRNPYHSIMHAGNKGMQIPWQLPLDLNLTILTENPTKIRIPYAKTYATTELTINCDLKRDLTPTPYLSGKISLEGGYLRFLRNKLNVQYGNIQFVENQMNDPFIDLIAKNRINKYVVTLRATGALQKPNILLESVPELTEEQVLGLLMVGSEDATLQADLPTMFLQNLDLFFPEDKKRSKKRTAFFDKISKTLKYIQITPDFSDQTKLGGLKGSISVNLNDQLRAKVQKSFNLQKDFSAQLEYFLSDDINVKLVKDHRGELGSEIEVRLKL